MALRQRWLGRSADCPWSPRDVSNSRRPMPTCRCCCSGVVAVASMTPWGEPSAAWTRWRVRASSSAKLAVAGVARPRWEVELAWQRSGEPFPLSTPTRARAPSRESVTGDQVRVGSDLRLHRGWKSNGRSHPCRPTHSRPSASSAGGRRLQSTRSAAVRRPQSRTLPSRAVRWSPSTRCSRWSTRSDGARRWWLRARRRSRSGSG